MHCPNCNHDSHAVFQKPDRFPDHDLRTAQCAQCGLQLELITRIKSVYVFNPVTEERESIPLERFISDDYRSVMRHEKQHPAIQRFREEHGNA